MPDTADILVIGGGTAALCAAITARQSGARVHLLEHAPRERRGGNTRHSRNLRYTHAQTTPWSSGPYPSEDFHADLHAVTRGLEDAALADLLIGESADIPAWLQAQGVHLQPMTGGILPNSRKTVFLLGGGMGMLNRLYARAEALGVTIEYECEATALKLANGQVQSVTVRTPAGTRTLHPRSVIACCGGAQASHEWLRRSWGPVADGFINRGTPYAQGAILDALLRQGVRSVGDPHGAHLVAIDARSPEDGGIVTRIRCMPCGIVVNREAQRFHDEGIDTASTRYAVWGRKLVECSEQTAWLLLDAQGMATAPPSLYPPVSAASWDELAAQTGLDATALRATIERYNAATRAPEDGEAARDWHTTGLEPPKSRDARPLRTPPFAAYPMRPGITFTCQGVGVDSQARVQFRDGTCATNLHAAGMIMASNIIPHGYVSGLALSIGIVFGRIAGREAARHA